ncbi:acetylornithine transaminase [Bacillus horti]|nr:acetylornithine transaminase [Bacillus horti]
MNTYGRFPLTLVKGSGSYVWDDQGNKYLDFTSGIATCNLGHTPEKVKQKVKEQLDELWHCSNLYHIPNQEQLAGALVQYTFADQVFFCNSGAEANEGAIKLARKYASEVKGIAGDEPAEIVTFAQSFHGRTMATLSATGQEKIQQGFGPLVKGFRYLPYNDVAALDDLVQEQTVAVLLELVQGEGGIVPADVQWVQKLVELCKQNDILLMVDEIQTGMGRSGTLFAYEQYGFEPDVMTVAKGLGSGIPIGALLAKEKVSRVLQPGTHGSTFGGNPLATAAGLATLDIISQPDFLKQVQEAGDLLQQQLKGLQAEFSCIQAIRGKGMLVGLYMPEHAAKLVEKLRDEHILVLLAGPQVVRILPPLTVSEEELNQFIAGCKKALSQMTS